MERVRRSLVLKISLLFLVATVPPYLIVSALYFQSSRKALYQEIVKGLRRETALIRDNLDARLFLLRGNAVAWAGLEVMKDIITDDVDKRIASVLEGLKRDYGLTGDIYAINRGGRVVASSNPRHIGKEISAPWLDDALGGRIVDLDIHPSDVEGGEDVISFAVPIRAPSIGPGVIGVLLLEYKPSDLRNLIFTGESPLVAILDRRGEVVVSSRDGLVRDAVGKGVTERTGYIVAMERLRGYFGFPGFDWTVVGAVKEEEALYPVRRIERISLWAGMSGVVIILLLVSFFASRAIRPIKDLSEMAERIAKTKDLSLRVRAPSHDEVGRLADAFNNMVEEVRGHIERIKEMEEEVRRADRLSALGELSAGMAHEIKNPLGIIKSSADLLKERLGKGSPDWALVSAISEEAGRLARILEAFLQFARPRPPQIGPCNINEVVRRSLKLLEPEIRKARISLEVELGEVPTIEADGDQLHQVFVNIVINAIQAMEGGGTLRVCTKRVAFPAGPEGSGEEAVEVAFSDTGSGIPPEHRERIFNPFFTTKERGSGLGLAIVHRIIEGLGGRVRVEEGRPRGAIFTIYLPLRRGKYEDHTRR